MTIGTRTTRLGANHLMNAIGLRHVIETMALARSAARCGASRLRRNSFGQAYRRIGDSPDGEHGNRQQQKNHNGKNGFLQHENTCLDARNPTIALNWRGMRPPVSERTGAKERGPLGIFTLDGAKRQVLQTEAQHQRAQADNADHYADLEHRGHVDHALVNLRK